MVSKKWTPNFSKRSSCEIPISNTQDINYKANSLLEINPFKYEATPSSMCPLHTGHFELQWCTQTTLCIL